MELSRVLTELSLSPGVLRWSHSSLSKLNGFDQLWSVVFSSRLLDILGKVREINYLPMFDISATLLYLDREETITG